MNPTTRELTRAIGSGDPEAFSRFYEAWFDRMFAIAATQTRRDESFCLDVVQDAMMKVIRRMPVVESEAALAAWLKRAVVTTAYDRIRAESRRRRHEKGAPRSSAASGDEVSDEAVLARLRAELGRLDPPLERILHARHALGWTLARIGSAMGLSPSAVDGRLGRATRLLATRLSEGPHD